MNYIIKKGSIKLIINKDTSLKDINEKEFTYDESAFIKAVINDLKDRKNMNWVPSDNVEFIGDKLRAYYDGKIEEFDMPRAYGISEEKFLSEKEPEIRTPEIIKKLPPLSVKTQSKIESKIQSKLPPLFSFSNKIKKLPPIKSPVKSPLKKLPPIKSPVKSPLKKLPPIKSPVKSPLKKLPPIKSPLPVKSSVKKLPPIKSPLPVKSSVKNLPPIKSPLPVKSLKLKKLPPLKK